MRFRSVVRLGGKTATGIPVPEEVVEGRRYRPLRCFNYGRSDPSDRS
jgi:hypothetical protein